MVVLFDSKCLKECLKINQTGIAKHLKIKKFYDIILNESTKVLFSKKYIEHLEKILPDVEVFQAFITELSDTNNLATTKTSNSKTVNEEFIEMYENCSSNFIFPISIDNDLVHLQFNEKTFTKIKPNGFKYEIIDSLLTKGAYTVSYQDFKVDSEINDFFKDVFSIPRLINKAVVFDREKNFDFLSNLKGNLIFYYTLFKNNERAMMTITKAELRTELGGKLKLFYTSQARLIHERKIIIDGLLITVDNSLKNLTIHEPTWEINIGYNYTKVEGWLEKCSKFKEVN